MFFAVYQHDHRCEPWHTVRSLTMTRSVMWTALQVGLKWWLQRNL